MIYLRAPNDGNWVSAEQTPEYFRPTSEWNTVRQQIEVMKDASPQSKIFDHSLIEQCRKLYADDLQILHFERISADPRAVEVITQA